MQPFKLIILDRDGVINCDSDSYIKCSDEWVPIPGALEAIATLKRNGWTVAIATNQSGIARGLFSKTVLFEIHQKMHEMVEAVGGKIDYLAFCPHGPNDSCHCRKPAPGMYLEIAEYFKCELDSVPVVGDSKRDLEAANAVGAQPVLVLTGKGVETWRNGGLAGPVRVFADLSSFVDGLG